MPLLNEFREALQKLYGDRLVATILFGSQARGDSVPDSDIDIMVVLKGTVDPGQENDCISDLAATMSLEHDVVISCIFMAEARYRDENSPLLLNVREEGVLL